MDDVPGFGLDRFSVSFPVKQWERDPGAWSMQSVRGAGTSTRSSSWSTTIDRGLGSTFVGVMDVAEAPGVWAKLEANPSRLCSSYPEPAPVAALIDGVREALASAGSLVTPTVSLHEFRVRRLDVARDFDGVGRPSWYVQGLRGAHRPWARRSFVYSDPKRNLAETLFVGSAAGGCRLYDKHAETSEAPEGRVRWEVEARAPWLDRYAGVNTLADVTEGSVRRLAADRWKWSAMGVEVVGGASLVAKVRASDLSPAQGRAFLGWLLEVAYGDDPSAAKGTVAKYRRLARDLGIVVSPDAFAETVTLTGRLDFDQGAEVLTVAA